MTEIVVCLTVAHVRRMHKKEVVDRGGTAGEYPGRLEATVNRCQAGMGGWEAFPTLHDKGAALFMGLAQGHAFVDGNKRIALLATTTFYKINGYTLRAEQVDLIKLTSDVAAKRKGVGHEAVVNSFRQWARAMKLPGDYGDFFD